MDCDLFMGHLDPFIPQSISLPEATVDREKYIHVRQFETLNYAIRVLRFISGILLRS